MKGNKKVKEIDIKNCTFYDFGAMTRIMIQNLEKQMQIRNLMQIVSLTRLDMNYQMALNIILF